MKQREIKFRGFDAKQNKWLYGNLITKIDPQHAEDVFWCYLIHDGALSAEVVATESVGQFTGLLDKNGKECYEDDIIICSVGHPERIDKPLSVIFANGSFQMDRSDWEYPCAFTSYAAQGFIQGKLMNMEDVQNSLEIIGNIYQNPDLLK